MNNLSIRKMSELTKKKKKGFTLVELIIVIAIIAILAAIAIPKFGQVTRNANIKSDIANAKNLHGIAAQYISEHSPVAAGDITSSVLTAVDGGQLPKVKASSGNFFVVLETNNDITIRVGSASGTIVYPNAGGIYAS